MKEINLPSIAKDKLLKYSQGKLFLLNQLIKNDIFPKINLIDLVDYLKENKYIKNLFELCPINSDDVTNAISIIFIYPQLFPTLYEIGKNNILIIIVNLHQKMKKVILILIIIMMILIIIHLIQILKINLIFFLNSTERKKIKKYMKKKEKMKKEEENKNNNEKEFSLKEIMKKNIENEEQFKYSLNDFVNLKGYKKNLLEFYIILISSCKMIPSNDNEKNKSENIENIVYFSSLLKQIVLNDYFEKIIDKKLDENQIKKIDVNKKILENTKITLKNLEKLEDIKFNFEKEEENKKYKEIIKVIENWKETYEKFESSLKDLYSTKTNQLELRKIERIRRN